LTSGSRRLLLAAVIVGVLLVVVLSLAAAAVAIPAVVLGATAVVALLAGRLTRGRVGAPRRAEPVAHVPADDRHDSSVPATSSDTRWKVHWESYSAMGAVTNVRGDLAPMLAGWGLAGEATEPTLVVVTELICNAVEHGSAPVTLSVNFLGDLVRVEVHDASSDPPQRQPHDPRQQRGRGLHLVEGLSSQWGWTQEAGGKTVWAQVLTEWPS
jgi:anti-sigma regulatory factor (Ser/Thr protein kinase)